ncbi:hypothetical protein [Candidatus Chlamydia sanziniae]|uniref:Uncharacterized protein n=1 Tax=Candidatus Chlamydia sanziniae TaxID=1806891 RepID=A0A1A9HWA2_9CHLA|nr:hypothetical protein [Candidatus Chlamydia sanziniae]ANH79125.1 hypothetical protein Cs308_0955 [Candidatus Chlamydia sanziniae]
MQKVPWLRWLEEGVINSWWVILSVLISGFIYDRAIHEVQQEELRLQSRVTLLQEKILKTKEEQIQLQLHLEHWDIPAVIESALIQRLGLIPKGYVKVYRAPGQTTKE